MFYKAVVNKVLCHCHSWLARQYLRSFLDRESFICQSLTYVHVCTAYMYVQPLVYHFRVALLGTV